MQQETASQQQPTQNILEAKVVSNNLAQTLTVVIERRVKHKRYNKYQILKKKLLVHDEKNLAKVNDNVLIRSSRPHSKMKSWELVKVI